MKVSKGKLKRKYLRSSHHSGTRPTARRLREMLFEVLSWRIEGAQFLDLCAGSGAVGIEALSRGATHVTFVDQAAEMRAVIEENLGTCGVAVRERAEILTTDAASFLREVSEARSRTWGIAYFDPPYAIDYEPTLAVCGTGEVIERRGGVLVIEHHHEKRLSENLGKLRRWRIIRQGESCLSFYERKF